jgi:hypothetical protein
LHDGCRHDGNRDQYGLAVHAAVILIAR